MCGFQAPRPLYGLDRLATRPDAPVLVCEGEKAVDAARDMFPDHVAVTTPGGANTAHKVDFNPLAGRSVTIVPDHDAAGAQYARRVAKLAEGAAAKSVAIVDIPACFPEKWDLADEIPDGWSEDDLRELVRNAASGQESKSTAPVFPPDYRMLDDGFYFIDPETGIHMRLSGSFEVIAQTRDNISESWGLLLCWKDDDGHVHELSIPRSLLAGDGARYREILLDGGLYVAPQPKARNFLTAALAQARISTRARAVKRVGWHTSPGGQVFVMPDETFGDQGSERVLLQIGGRLEHRYQISGSLKDWQDSIGRPCVGNSRLALAVAAAFAPPLLNLMNEPSGGIHFVGQSQTGKTTILRVAGTVWGGGGVNGYLDTWRATSNGLEAVAAEHCDTLLCLDEMGQVDAREVGEIAYMIANGTGKKRAARDGSGRAPVTWRALLLSTGEIDLAAKMRENGKQPRAGQEVRLVDVPIDLGGAMGAFEAIHEFGSSLEFVTHLRSQSDRFYGTPIRAFLGRLVALDTAELVSGINDAQREFLEQHVPAGASGQVFSVARRFALIAAAGSLATALGVLPWPAEEANRAAAACFTAWLQRRGGAGASEIDSGIARIRHFIEAHGSSRFEIVGEDVRVHNRAGYRKRTPDGDWDYLVTPEVFRNEVCAGFDHRIIGQALIERGLLVTDNSGRLSPARLVGPTDKAIKRRVFHIRGRILEGPQPANDQSDEEVA